MQIHTWLMWDRGSCWIGNRNTSRCTRWAIIEGSGRVWNKGGTEAGLGWLVAVSRGRATRWRELRDDGGPRGGCPGDARDICQRDERWVDRTSTAYHGGSYVYPAETTDARADLSLSGQAILNRIRLRRLIKGPTSLVDVSLSLSLSLSLSVCPSFCLSLYVLWFTSGGGRLPRSQSKGNPERSHDNVGSRSPRLIPAPDGNVLSSPRSRGCIFYRLPDVTLMDPRRYAIVARSTIARRESVWESCVNFSEEKLLFFFRNLWKSRKSFAKVIWNLALVNFLEQQFSTVIRIDEYIRRFLAAVISWINNVTSRTLINRLGRRVCVCKLGRVRRRDAGQYYYEDKRTDAIYHQGLPASAPWHPALGEYSSGWERRSIVNFCELRSAAGGTCQTDDFIFRTS